MITLCLPSVQFRTHRVTMLDVVATCIGWFWFREEYRSEWTQDVDVLWHPSVRRAGSDSQQRSRLRRRPLVTRNSRLWTYQRQVSDYGASELVVGPIYFLDLTQPDPPVKWPKPTRAKVNVKLWTWPNPSYPTHFARPTVVDYSSPWWAPHVVTTRQKERPNDRNGINK